MSIGRALKRPGEWSEFSYNALNSKTAASQSMFRSSIERGASDHDQALISEALADLDDVLRMFSSLTRISQIEADNRRAAFRTVNLGEIATEVAELFDAAAEGKGGRVEVFGDKAVRISADRDLLFDAISNLVDNAIKHGREGGVVIIHLDQKDSEAILSVSDDKPCCYPPCSMDRPRSRRTSAN
jgi:signal transduction histidine kinase